MTCDFWCEIGHGQWILWIREVREGCLSLVLHHWSCWQQPCWPNFAKELCLEQWGNFIWSVILKKHSILFWQALFNIWYNRCLRNVFYLYSQNWTVPANEHEKNQNVHSEQCKELLLVHTINHHWAQFCLSEEERGCSLYAVWLSRMKTLGGWVWVFSMLRGPLPQTDMSTLKPNWAELHQGQTTLAKMHMFR